MDKCETYNDPQCIKDIEVLFDNALFKVLSEPIRCELIKYLAIHGPSDIGTIAGNFPQDRSVISRHLSQMYKLNILKMTKESRRTVYELNPLDLLSKFEFVVEGIRNLIEE